MLKGAKLVAFAGTTNGARAAEFYGNVLGLTVRSDDAFAISIDAAGTELRLQKVERFKPQPFTVLGWQVKNVRRILERLADRGVSSERYSWLEQDEAGVWIAPSGVRVAWFKDPDGNILSVAQY